MKIAIRVDAGAAMGVGHLMRCIALAEEIGSRGIAVQLFGSTGGLEWAAKQLASRDLQLLPANDDDFAKQCLELAVSHAILDGYELPAQLGSQLQAAGIKVAALIDGGFGTHQVADLYVDHNLGAQPNPQLAASTLAGIDYAIVNDRVRSRRGLATGPHDPLRVLVVFGGTDAYNGAPVLVDCLRATELPCQISVITPNPEVAAALRQLPPVTGQHLEVLAGVADLPGLAVDFDLVVSAAGTSLWELMCLGLPIAAVCVVDNQLVGYEQVLAADVVIPIGLLESIRTLGPARDLAVEELRRALTDSSWRAQLASRGAQLVDGDGRCRVIDALLNL